MNAMPIVADTDFWSASGESANFQSAKSPVNRLTQETYAQQTVCMPHYMAEQEIGHGVLSDSLAVDRADNPHCTAAQYMRVDLGCFDVGVAE